MICLFFCLKKKGKGANYNRGGFINPTTSVMPSVWISTFDIFLNASGSVLPSAANFAGSYRDEFVSHFISGYGGSKQISKITIFFRKYFQTSN